MTAWGDETQVSTWTETPNYVVMHHCGAHRSTNLTDQIQKFADSTDRSVYIWILGTDSGWPTATKLRSYQFQNDGVVRDDDVERDDEDDDDGVGDDDADDVSFNIF